MTEKTVTIYGGSQTYWRQQREGFALIRLYSNTLKRAEQSPQFYGSYEGEEMIARAFENLGPWERWQQVHDSVVAHPGFRRIMTAWGFQFKERPEWEIPMLMNARGRYPSSREIPVFEKPKTRT
jgi:hypothetical protein